MGKVFLKKGLFLSIVIIFFELLLKFALFKDFFTSNLIYIFMFSLSSGFFIALLLSLFDEKINSLLLKVFLLFLGFYYFSQIVYYDTYGSIISLYSFSKANEVMEFKNTIIKMVLSNFVFLVVAFAPFIISFIPKFNIFKFKKENKKNLLSLMLITIIINILSLSSLLINKNSLYSPFDLYFNTNSPLISVEKLGLLTTMKIDIRRTLFGFEEQLNIEIDKDDHIVKEPLYEPNIIPYDFDYLIEKEENKNISTLHNYFSNKEPTLKNEYSGLFKNKNLIIILAEALDPIAIDKDITPTLYKMANDGFQFSNYYTPLFPVSTSDGEYLQQVGLLPKEGVWSLKESKDNYLPFTLANMMGEKGYSTQAYHGHTGTYYSRYLSIPNLGYESFKACKMGLDINCKSWPESDLEMIDSTIHEYINDEKFLAYYISISGHLNYTKTGNAMVRKNWDYVKDLPYSELTKGYLAAQKELDLALESLIKTLEEANKLDDTVIVINPDHYPYGLKLENLNEMSDYYRDETFEKHHSSLIIWNNQLENKKIDTLCSNIDTIPTLANLFDLQYDSRLLIGNDIFSEHEPLVIFPNKSFISKKGKYDSIKKHFEGLEVSEDYINSINNDIYNKFEISKQILDTNYYNYLK